ncbi:MAG: helix-turn-helix transcriptional regulator [Cellulomonas sp.]
MASMPRVDDPGTAGPALSDPRSPRLGPRRQAVLQHLQQATGPLGVDEVASLTTLHPNTARFHLDALTADGLVTRAVEARTTPGRPRVLYEARADAPDQRSYALLAEMLAEWAAATDDGHETALAAGRAWGRRFVDGAPPAEPLDADRAVDVLRKVFLDIGFQPETSTDGPTTSLTLRHCPFREVAVRHPEVVCGMHLGIMEGVLDGLGGAVVPVSLERLVRPGQCLARVHRVSTP